MAYAKESNETTMDIDDLEPGDVLVFSGEKGSLISEAIMLLTGAGVSHAAIAYSEPRQIVEETPPAVRLIEARERFEGRTIYVNRLQPPPASMAPVLDAATDYVNAEEPYAMSNLYLVGLLLLYKRFTTSTPMQRVVIRILKKLTASLIDYINAHKAPGKLPMVCSQFVYQCFDDAGTGYRLQIAQPIVLRGAGAPMHEGSMLDRVIHRLRSDRSPAFQSQLLAAGGPSVGSVPDQTEEDLLRELVHALRTPEEGGAEDLEDGLVLAVCEFSQAAHSARMGRALAPEALLSASRIGASPDALNFLKAEEAYFVTPADLLDGCTNLARAGTIPA